VTTPLDEIKRLRQQIANKDAELAARNRELAELRSLVSQHLEATAEDPERIVRLEHAAFERGYSHGDEMGWRRGVEHALIEADRAHWRGDAHDAHGQMRELGMHRGPVPEPMTPGLIVAQAEKDNELMARWWEKEYNSTHPDGMPITAHKQTQVHQIRPEERDAEREAG
jgi:hypothetical protein